MSNQGVSIIICCYNSVSRLRPTLEYLQQQVNPSAINWEVIIVDNNSKDTTAGLAFELLSTSKNVDFKIITEKKPGLTNARICGAAAAKYSILSFIDDDNWIASNWVEVVNSIFINNPRVGAAGGKSEAVHETLPAPDWFDSYAETFAVGNPYKKSGFLNTGEYLWGAGLSISKEAWNKIFNDGQRIRLTGRKESKLTSGEDAEICMLIHSEGYRLWYEEKLSLKHFIPANKMNEDNLYKMHEGFGQAELTLRIYRSLFDNSIKIKSPWWLEFFATLKYFFRVYFTNKLKHKDPIRKKTELAFLKGYVNEFLHLKSGYDTLRQEIVIPHLSPFSTKPKNELDQINGLMKTSVTSDNELHINLRQEGIEQLYHEEKKINLETHSGISVIVCCYNGEKTIHSCLEALGKQKNSINFKWELILVDNNPSENITRLAQDEWNNENISMKIVSEKREGLLHAKLKGYKESTFSLLAYLEDDTIIADNWLENVYKHFIDYPDCGIVGGNNKPIYMIEPPFWLKNYIHQFAVGKQGKKEIENITESRGYLWGAGIVVRKSILDTGIAGGFIFADARRRDHLVSGVDTEFCWLARVLGLKLYYNENLQLVHVINAHRMSWINMQQLYRKLGSESITIDFFTYYFKYNKKGVAHFLLLRMYLGSLRRFFITLFKYIFVTPGKMDNINFLMLWYYRGRMKELGIYNLFENVTMINHLNKFLSSTGVRSKK